jgi:hypothetical protein
LYGEYREREREREMERERKGGKERECVCICVVGYEIDSDVMDETSPRDRMAWERWRRHTWEHAESATRPKQCLGGVRWERGVKWKRGGSVTHRPAQRFQHEPREPPPRRLGQVTSHRSLGVGLVDVLGVWCQRSAKNCTEHRA